MSDPGQSSAAGTPTGLARVRVALSAVVVVILALTGLLAAPPASASSLVGARNGVAAFDRAGGQVVGVHEPKLPGESRQRAPGYDQIVVGSCVAPEAEGAAAADSVPQFARAQYGRAPASLRGGVLSENPTCVYCGESPSTQLKHVDSLKQDWVNGGWQDDYATRTTRVNDPSNLAGA